MEVFFMNNKIALGSISSGGYLSLGVADSPFKLPKPVITNKDTKKNNKKGRER